MKTRFMQSESMRMRLRDLDQRILGGKMYPVMIEPFRQSEGGMLAQTIEVDVDPVVGRLESKMFAYVASVFVPSLAIEKLKYPLSNTAGYADMFRDKHIDGMVFDIEQESLMSKTMCINPRSIDGVKMVNEIATIGHNVAINWLRKRKYLKAPQLDAENRTLTPAMISDTSLDRFNGVLDPDETINGAVNLSGTVPVMGAGLRKYNAGTLPNAIDHDDVTQADGSTGTLSGYSIDPDGATVGQAQLIVEKKDGEKVPDLRADFDLADGSALTLKHLWQAKTSNELIRAMDKIVRENPEHGEEIVARWAFGLEMDVEAEPQLVFEKEVELGDKVTTATDGPNLDVIQTETGVILSFSRMMPKTEFGGVVITFVALKPDEVLAQQPDPILSDVWGGFNFAADELVLDPDKVTARDLWSDVPVVSEGEIMMYVGHNNMHRSFVDYGFAKTVDTEQVSNKNKMWRHEIPLTVSPETILYPDEIPHYPWADQTGDVAWVRVRSQQTVATPMNYGATPIETNQAISELGLLNKE